MSATITRPPIAKSPDLIRYRIDADASGGQTSILLADIVSDAANGALRAFLQQVAGSANWTSLMVGNFPQFAMSVIAIGATGPAGVPTFGPAGTPDRLLVDMPAVAGGFSVRLDMVFRPSQIR